MNALQYLFFTKLKNYFKSYRQNISRLIVLVLFIALLVLSFFSSKGNVTAVRDISELYSILFALYLFAFLMGSIQGLNSGASFYTLSDVNILFLSPIHSKLILLYGLIKQMGTSLFVGLFLLFQYSWLHNLYGISISDLLVILLCYALSIFASNLTAMVIYSFSSQDPQKQKLVKYIVYAFCILIGVIIFLPAMAKIMTGKSLLEAVVLSSSAPIISLVPVAGWLQVLTASWIIGNKAMFVFALLPVLVYLLVAVWLFLKLHSDFYEEVLLATERRHSTLSNAKEGRIADNAPQKIKLEKTGIRRGSGASVLFYKQLLENRRSRVFLLDKFSLIYIAITIAIALMIKQDGLIPVFALSVYLSIFSTAFSRSLKELTLHYAYLIPAKPALKLLAIFTESILKTAVESTIIFIIIGLIYDASVAEILICIFARTSFGILFLAVNILIEKFLKGAMSRVIMIVLYFIILAVLGAPGIIIGVLLSNTISAISTFNFVLIISFIWNILASAGIGYLCRDLLQYPNI